MRTGLFIALILFILASFFPRQLLGFFTTDQTIIEAGMSYLTIIRFTYFFFAITQILLATLRGVEIAGIAFALSVMTLVINCTINWIHLRDFRYRSPGDFYIKNFLTHPVSTGRIIHKILSKCSEKIHIYFRINLTMNRRYSTILPISY